MNFKDIFEYDESSPSCLRWKIDVFGGREYKTQRITKGDIAGSICEGNEYYRVTFKGKQLKVHRVIYEMFNGDIPKKKDIDHFDRKVTNNKIGNLRLVPHKINGRNQKKRTTNTSGVTGVHPKYLDGILVSWVADVKTDSGRISKSFSVRKYPDAFGLAVKFRENLIKSTEGYTQHHGLIFS